MTANGSIGANPYIVGNPIRGSAMFFGRDADFDFLGQRLGPSAGGDGAIVVLCGARRAGKTSLLLQVAGGRLGPAVFPIYADLQQLGDARGTAGLWRFFCARAVARVKEDGLATDRIEREIPSEDDRSPNDRLRAFLAALVDTLGARRPVFLVDEYEALEHRVHSGAIGVEALDGLAAILDAGSPVSFVLAGSFRLEQRDPEVWGRLVSRAVHRRISFLTARDAERLVREPLAGRVEYDAGTVEAVLRATACQPFLVQVVCQAIVDRLIEGRRGLCTMEDVEAAIRATTDEALPQLTFWWRSIPFLGRVAASIVAGEASEAAAYVPPEHVEAVLERDRASLGVAIDKPALRGALEALVESEDLERDDSGAYRYRADLVRRWVAEAHPVFEVVRAVGEEVGASAREGVHVRARPRRALSAVVVLAILAAAAVAILWSRPWGGDPGAGGDAPVLAGGESFARGWRLGPDLVPVPTVAEDAATIRVEAGRLVSFRPVPGESGVETTITWPLGVPAPARGWIDALAHPDESWLWGLVPALAPDPEWLAGAAERWEEEVAPGALPGWIASLLVPVARISVRHEGGGPARVEIADRTGWTRSVWCVAPGEWVRCGGKSPWFPGARPVRRIAFTFQEHGDSRTSLLSRVRFLSADGGPAPDALGRVEIAFLYRDVEPAPGEERWEVETVLTTMSAARETTAGAAPFSPPPGWEGVGTDGVALGGDRVFAFYYRHDHDLRHRGGEVAAIQIRDHVGRAAALGLPWAPRAQTFFFERAPGVEAAFFVGTDGAPAPDAFGAAGYREERNAAGVRTRLVLLGPDGRCVAGERPGPAGPASWCEVSLAGVPVVEPSSGAFVRLAAPYALAWAGAAGPAPTADGTARLAIRDLGKAPQPCDRALAAAHESVDGRATSPTSGPFAGSAMTRLGVRMRDGRLADVVRTDCFDGPCTRREVFDETWSCNDDGCLRSTVALECR